jgi:glycogen phosphorylase
VGFSLPRHLEIIYEINRRFLDEVRAKFPADEDRVRRMSLIGEDGGKNVRMAHLATVGSHAINGVAALHSELLKESVLKDFYEMWPERFSNKTNGVTPRRFLALANPGLRELLDRTIGDGWLTDLGRLRGLEPFVEDTSFRAQWRDIKRSNKARLAKYIRSATGVELNPDRMFDVQVKRIHEYKRQHLNALHIVALYHRLKQNPGLSIPQRSFIFGGKAAPGYFMAKRIIKLINGALTIGTLDGANVEMRDEVGPENFFLFGLTESEVEDVKAKGYRPADYIDGNDELRAVLDLIAAGTFSHGDTEVFRPLVDNLRYDDPFLVCADYASYVNCQEQVSAAWQDRDSWTKMSILNTAHSGKFSSDRAIAEYCDDIWSVWPLTVTM